MLPWSRLPDDYSIIETHISHIVPDTKFLPNSELIDDMYRVPDRDAFLHARKLVKEEGVLGGGSSGAALWGVLKLARSLEKPARIVTIFPGSASRNLSTIFNDQWMKSKGLL